MIRATSPRALRKVPVGQGGQWGENSGGERVSRCHLAPAHPGWSVGVGAVVTWRIHASFSKEEGVFRAEFCVRVLVKTRSVMLRGWQRRLSPQCGSYCPNTIQGCEELGDDAGFGSRRGESHECDRPAAFQKERPIKEQDDWRAAMGAMAKVGRRGDFGAIGQLAERYDSPTLKFACAVAGPLASGKRNYSSQTARHADEEMKDPRGECMVDQVGGDQVNCLAPGALRVAHHDEWGDGRHAVPPDRPGRGGHGLRARGRCELFCGEQGPLGPPRDDLLTYDQTRQLHTELLAGNAQPEELPRFLKDLVVIADTGCGTSFGNTARLFIDTYKCDTSINGASGMFTARTKGTMKLPMMDDKDNRLLH